MPKEGLILSEMAKRCVQRRYLSGFEWPSVLWINFKEEPGDDANQQKPSKDIVLRTVSALVKVRLPKNILFNL